MQPGHAGASGAEPNGVGAKPALHGRSTNSHSACFCASRGHCERMPPDGSRRSVVHGDKERLKSRPFPGWGTRRLHESAYQSLGKGILIRVDCQSRTIKKHKFKWPVRGRHSNGWRLPSIGCKRSVLQNFKGRTCGNRRRAAGAAALLDRAQNANQGRWRTRVRLTLPSLRNGSRMFAIPFHLLAPTVTPHLEHEQAE